MKKLFAFLVLIVYVMSVRIRDYEYSYNDCEDECISNNYCFSVFEFDFAHTECYFYCLSQCRPKFEEDNESKKDSFDSCVNDNCPNDEKNSKCLYSCLDDVRSKFKENDDKKERRKRKITEVIV